MEGWVCPWHVNRCRGRTNWQALYNIKNWNWSSVYCDCRLCRLYRNDWFGPIDLFGAVEYNAKSVRKYWLESVLPYYVSECQQYSELRRVEMHVTDQSWPDLQSTISVYEVNDHESDYIKFGNAKLIKRACKEYLIVVEGVESSC